MQWEILNPRKHRMLENYLTGNPYATAHVLDNEKLHSMMKEE